MLNMVTRDCIPARNRSGNVNACFDTSVVALFAPYVRRKKDMEYTIKELIEALQAYDEKMQVAIFNHASQIHNTNFLIDIACKSQELTELSYPEGALHQTFLSIRSLE
jgi:hypothetical protein